MFRASPMSCTRGSSARRGGTRWYDALGGIMLRPSPNPPLDLTWTRSRARHNIRTHAKHAQPNDSAQFEHTLLITETGVEMLTGKLPTSIKQVWEPA